MKIISRKKETSIQIFLSAKLLIRRYQLLLRTFELMSLMATNKVFMHSMAEYEHTESGMGLRQAYTHPHTHKHTHTHTHTHMYVCIYIYICVCLYIYIYIYIKDVNLLLKFLKGEAERASKTVDSLTKVF